MNNVCFIGIYILYLYFYYVESEASADILTEAEPLRADCCLSHLSLLHLRRLLLQTTDLHTIYTYCASMQDKHQSSSMLMFSTQYLRGLCDRLAAHVVKAEGMEEGSEATLEEVDIKV